jgi:prepilin-type N-terminal cleavage/methylation domain-containing protein
MNAKQSSLRQRGFTLLELSVSIGIAALLMVVVMEARIKELHDAQVGAEASWVIDVMKDVRDNLANDVDYGGVSDSSLNVGSLPRAYLSVSPAGVAVRNGLGGDVHLASRNMTSANRALALTYSGVTSDNCVSLVTAFESMSHMKGLPLYAIVGSVPSVKSTVPMMSWDVSKQTFVPVVADDVLLKKSPSEQLDVVATAQFCRKKTALKSITLVRTWA